MKGLSQTLVIIVTAIVILVAALVVLTIFGLGIQRFATITEVKSYCGNVASSICAVTKDTQSTMQQLRTIKVEYGENTKSNCAEVLNDYTC